MSVQKNIMSFLVWVMATWLLVVVHVTAEPAPPGSVPMRIWNRAGSPIEMFWINIFERDTSPLGHPLVRQTPKPIRNNTDFTVNSYDTHAFIVKFLNEIPGTETQFVKGPKQETITVTYETQSDGNKKLVVRQVTKYDEAMVKINNATTICGQYRGIEFDQCVGDGLVNDVVKIADAKDEIIKYRNLMSERLRNYTCADDKMETSKALYEKPIAIPTSDGESVIHYNIKVLFETSHAKIWTIDRFITDEECRILERHAKPLLKRATVAAEDGTSIVSENRKAQQAGYDLHQTNPFDPLVPLFQRVLGVTNTVAGYNLTPEGQEDFTVIQYNPQDQYSPHCDGDCNSNPHNVGGRVATAVMYCKVARRGGGTTFTKADVFVKPTKGQATFFSYKGHDGIMEDGFTEHSGCPVLAGEKWITTSWMREGVTAEKDWKIYDPSGVPIQGEEEAIIDEEEEEEEIGVDGTSSRN